MDWKQAKADVRLLSLDQRIAFDKVIEVCKKNVMSQSKFNIDNPPKQMIVQGGGGVGKSKLISVIAVCADKVLRKAGDKDTSEKPKILLLGPTGMAASLIGGTTLHSGLDFNFDPLGGVNSKI